MIPGINSLPCDDGVTVDGFLAFRIVCSVPDRENSGHEKWFGTEPAFGLGPDLRLLEIGHKRDLICQGLGILFNKFFIPLQWGYK